MEDIRWREDQFWGKLLEIRMFPFAVNSRRSSSLKLKIRLSALPRRIPLFHTDAKATFSSSLLLSSLWLSSSSLLSSLLSLLPFTTSFFCSHSLCKRSILNLTDKKSFVNIFSHFFKKKIGKEVLREIIFGRILFWCFSSS